MDEEKKQLIIVAGPEASGKKTFAEVFKTAFLQGLPEDNLYKGIISGMSFYCVSSLSTLDEVKLVKLAKEKGYRVTIYFLFTPRELCLVRARLRSIVSKIPYNEIEMKAKYDSSRKNLAELKTSTDIVFFIRNLKEFDFVSALSPSELTARTYQLTIQKVQLSVELPE